MIEREGRGAGHPGPAAGRTDGGEDSTLAPKANRELASFPGYRSIIPRGFPGSSLHSWGKRGPSEKLALYKSEARSYRGEKAVLDETEWEVSIPLIAFGDSKNACLN